MMLAGRLAQLIEGDLIFGEPLGVRVARIEALLDLLVRDDAAFRGIDQEHFAGLEAALFLDVVGLDGEDAGFRGHDDQVVVRDDVAGRAQAVAVEGCADDAAVGEGDSGGPVPRLHEGGVVFVERALLRVHVGITGPGFGDKHGHGVGQVAAGHEEQLDGVIEAGGIAATGRDDGEELAQIVAEQGGRQHGLAGVHPVDVAAEGIDFAVVGDVAVGVGELPGGEGVGGEALVDEAEGAHDVWVGQLAVEVDHLGSEQETFIDDGAGGERGEIEVALVGQVGGGDFGFSAFADDVEFALERVGIGALGAADEDLLDVGLGGAGDATDGIAIDGGIAPAEDGEAFLADDALQDTLAGQALVGLDGQKGHADAVFAFGREGEAEGGAFAGEELVGNLNENTGAVAGFGIAAAGSAVGEVDEYLNAFGDDVVGFVAFDAGDETDAAGVVLVAGVVKALGGGEDGGLRVIGAGDTLGVGHVFSLEATSVASLVVSRNMELRFI